MGDLQDINGIGNSVEKQLNEIGIETINALANAELNKLENEKIRNAEKILDRANKQGVQIKSGTAVEKEQENTEYISTGIEKFDDILGGGLQEGFLIGVAGEHKAGKTQLALHLLAASAQNNAPAIYIETEPNRFQIDRIKSLSENKESYQNIHKIEAYSPDPKANNLALQLNAYDAVRENFDDVSLIVVDSFVANFRLSGKFEDRSDLPERNRIVSKHLQNLQSISNQYNCPVIITLQTMGNPEMFSGEDLSIWGPVLMEHAITHLINMKHGKGELREAQIRGHPSMPDKSVTLELIDNEPIRSTE